MQAAVQEISKAKLAEVLPLLAEHCERNPGVLFCKVPENNWRFCGGIRVTSRPEGGQTVLGFYGSEVAVTLFFDSTGGLERCIGANGAVASSVGHENYQRGAVMIAKELGLVR